MVKKLEELVGLGEQLCSALRSGDVDAASVLLSERAVLIDGFAASGESPSGAETRQLVLRVQEQTNEMMQLLGEHEQAIGDSLREAAAVRRRRREYAEEPDRRRILHEGLTV